MGSLVLRGVNGGAVLVDGQLNNLIPDGSVGEPRCVGITTGATVSFIHS
jgi:hypothetical protein